MALGTAEHRPGSNWHGGDHELQSELYQSQQFPGIAMQEPIIPDPAKALGQDMLQYQPQEVLTLERAVPGLTGFAVNVLEGHLAVVIGNDVFFTDHATVQVTGQVLQGRLAFTDMLAVDHPLAWQLAG